jgi:hypothetical protein
MPDQNSAMPVACAKTVLLSDKTPTLQAIAKILLYTAASVGLSPLDLPATAQV